MPARASEMTVRQLEAIKPPKNPPDTRKAVGGASGLYVNIKPSGSKSWLFRYSFAGQRQVPIGLGGYSRRTNSLAAMRDVARGFNKLIKEGVDPKQFLKEKQQAELFKKAQGINFREVAEEWVKLKNTKKEWNDSVSFGRARAYMRDYVYPVLGHKVVIDIDVDDILNVLRPIWREKKVQTGTRLRGYLEGIIALGFHKAKAKNCSNPAIWKNNLDLVLGKPDAIAPPKNHPHIPWAQMPKFMKALYGLDKPKGSRPDVQCLALLALCGTRSSATRLMEWDEIDIKRKIWTIPTTSEAKKKRKSKELVWEIPLSPEALRIIRAQPKRKHTNRVFSTLAGNEIPDNYLSKLPRSLARFRKIIHNR